MRFVMTPVGSSGDVHPFIGIGRALAARGHEVMIVAGEPFERTIRQAGLGFHASHSAEEFDRITKDPDLWHPRRGLKIVLTQVVSALRRGYHSVRDVYEPGTILVGHSTSFATRIFEEQHHVPAATVHLAPSVFRSTHAMPALAPGVDLSWTPRWVKRGFWWAVDHLLIEPKIAPVLNTFRQELGLAPVSRIMGEWMHSPRRVIALFPPWFAPPQPDWPQALELTGFPLYDESDQHIVSPALERFLESGTPPIVFTPGSANRMASEFFRAAVDASDRLGRRALLLTRYSEHVPSLPSTAHHEPFAPLSSLLPRCAAIVHHGGIGTLAQGLAAGIPQLTMPMGFDQPDNATRLVRLGVGGWLRPGAFNGKNVAASLTRLLEDPRVADACRRCSDRLAQSSPIDRTCGLLEELGQPTADRSFSPASRPGTQPGQTGTSARGTG